MEDDPELGGVETFVGRNGTWHLLPQPLGTGGMARVLAGVGEDGTQVAIKVILTPTRDSQILAAREARLAQAAGAMESPHLLPVLDVVESGQRLLIVMPRATGHLRIQAGGTTPAEAVRTIAAVAEGLVALHDAGVVHRDLKPANVLELQGRLVLADYGLARDASVETGQPTRKGYRTPEYEAPELAEGVRASARSDLYALGCLSYEVLTGNPPFTGEVGDVARGHAQQSPAPLPGGIPVRLVTLVLDLLSKAPQDRPRDAREVVETLQRLAVPPQPPAVLEDALVKARHDRHAYLADHAATRLQREAWERTVLEGQHRLARLLQAAHERLELLDPDAEVQTQDPRGHALEGRDACLVVQTWPHIPICPPWGDAQQPDAVAGVVLAHRRPFDPLLGSAPVLTTAVPVANVVWEATDGTYAWWLYRLSSPYQRPGLAFQVAPDQDALGAANLQAFLRAHVDAPRPAWQPGQPLVDDLLLELYASAARRAPAVQAYPQEQQLVAGGTLLRHPDSHALYSQYSQHSRWPPVSAITGSPALWLRAVVALPPHEAALRGRIGAAAREHASRLDTVPAAVARSELVIAALRVRPTLNPLDWTEAFSQAGGRSWKGGADSGVQLRVHAETGVLEGRPGDDDDRPSLTLTVDLGLDVSNDGPQAPGGQRLLAHADVASLLVAGIALASELLGPATEQNIRYLAGADTLIHLVTTECTLRDAIDIDYVKRSVGFNGAAEYHWSFHDPLTEIGLAARRERRLTAESMMADLSEHLQ